MNRKMVALAFGLLLLIWCANGHAAILTRLNLVTDGSADPPGDRLEVTILFLPGEEELAVDLRVFAILTGQDQVTAVRGRNTSLIDPAGNLRIQTSVRRPVDSRAATVDIVVPYASLDLLPGRHKLAYEITGRRGATIDFVKATDMTPIVVSQRTRTTIRQSSKTIRYVERLTNRLAYVVEDGRVTERQVQLLVPTPVAAVQDREITVRIPGEFSRPKLVQARPSPEKSLDAGDQATFPLAGRAWESLAEFEPQRKRSIFYATNRGVAATSETTPARFGKTVGDLTYGVCVVNIPVEQHIQGKLEVPNWWNSRDPAKYFLVESVEPLDVAAFRERMSSNDILLFVHGYNTNFSFAVLRTAQLVHDLAFPGQGLAFSWPSAGGLTGYSHDEKAAQASVPALVKLFADLQATVNNDARSRKVHIIAHSMGNRVLLQAMRYFELQQGAPATEKLFGQVALAAPDVNGSLFGALIPSLVRQADHVTLYYCEADQALQASRELHKDMPVGLGPCFAEGVDTINADAVNTDVIGHGYYASAHELLVDLRLYVLNRLGPDERLPPLGERTEILGFSHWSFAPPR